MDVKTLSAMLGHVSAVTTLDIYTHITGDMQRAAADSIDRSIGKAEPQEETEPERKGIVDFQPYVGKKRKPGTGCVTEINDHLFEGRYSPYGRTERSIPATSTPAPARSARKSSRR